MSPRVWLGWAVAACVAAAGAAPGLFAAAEAERGPRADTICAARSADPPALGHEHGERGHGAQWHGASRGAAAPGAQAEAADEGDAHRRGAHGHCLACVLAKAPALEPLGLRPRAPAWTDPDIAPLAVDPPPIRRGWRPDFSRGPPRRGVAA